MAVTGIDGISSSTASRMLFGAGTLYRNFGQIDQEVIGATRGGASFVVARTERDIDLDGIGSRDVEGLVRTLGTRVTLEVVLPEISEQTWLDITRGTKETNNNKTRFSPGNESEIPSGQFYTNITLVAQEYDSNTTKPLILRNALAFGEWDIETRDLREAGLAVTFRAHYKNDDLNDPPYRVGILETLLRDWDPSEDLSGQTLTENINNKDGTLGSTTGADSNDPAWQNSPPALVFDEDDFVTESSTIWTTS